MHQCVSKGPKVDTYALVNVIEKHQRHNYDTLPQRVKHALFIIFEALIKQPLSRRHVEYILDRKLCYAMVYQTYGNQSDAVRVNIGAGHPTGFVWLISGKCIYVHMMHGKGAEK